MNYLCPLNIEDISLTGIYDSEAFHYVKIALMGCELESGCMEEEKIAKQTFELIMIKTSPNILGEQKSEMIEHIHDARHY